MTIRKILSYPAASHILKCVSTPVVTGDPVLLPLIEDLKDTLRAIESGVGLAAPQIGVAKRVFALKRAFIENDFEPGSRFRKTRDDILVFVNPKVVTTKGEVRDEEGCLSVPGQYCEIKRAKAVKLRALDGRGEEIYEKFKGLAARAIQQEIDHLDGILIIDHND